VYQAIIIKKKELVALIDKTSTFLNPRVDLEQYCIDAVSATDFIYFAGVEFNDIQNKIVLDLGTGTGRLSLLSIFLGSKYTLSIDVDLGALLLFRKNARKFNLIPSTHPIHAEISTIEFNPKLLYNSKIITTVMNPPFGVQKKFADRVFLQKAFEYSTVVYSIHLLNKKVNRFLEKFSAERHWKIDQAFPYNLTLEKSFPFHAQKTKRIEVMIYRFTKKN
jgi:putative methylase